MASGSREENATNLKWCAALILSNPKRLRRSSGNPVATFELNQQTRMIKIARGIEKTSEQIRGDRSVRHRIHPKTARRVECIVEVLQMSHRPPLGDKIPLDHALTMEIQNAALCKASTQGFTNFGRISAALLGEQQSLRNGADGDADDDLVGELGELACPSRSDMHGPAHRAQDWFELLRMRQLHHRP